MKTIPPSDFNPADYYPATEAFDKVGQRLFGNEWIGYRTIKILSSERHVGETTFPSEEHEVKKFHVEANAIDASTLDKKTRKERKNSRTDYEWDETAASERKSRVEKWLIEFLSSGTKRSVLYDEQRGCAGHIPPVHWVGGQTIALWRNFSSGFAGYEHSDYQWLSNDSGSPRYPIVSGQLLIACAQLDSELEKNTRKTRKQTGRKDDVIRSLKEDYEEVERFRTQRNLTIRAAAILASEDTSRTFHALERAYRRYKTDYLERQNGKIKPN